MSDPLDEAQEKTEAERVASIARVTARLDGESESHCANCGTEIPERRRAAVPGVKTCIDCQEELERPR